MPSVADPWPTTVYAEVMPRLRPARVDDHALYLRLFGELGVDDPPADVERWADEIVAETLVLEERGAAVGYVVAEVLDGLGYLRQIVVDPTARGRGLGRFAMARLAERFQRAGCTAWCLSVKPDNAPALALYRRMGLWEQHRAVSLRLRWSLIDDPDAFEELGDLGALRCTTPQAGDLPSLERRLAIPAGLAVRAASRPRVVVTEARRGDEPLGLACFEPTVPGCLPFRAADVTTAVALLTALRLHADPAAPYLQIVIEDAPLLVVALERAGAFRVLELAQYRGALPPP